MLYSLFQKFIIKKGAQHCWANRTLFVFHPSCTKFSAPALAIPCHYCPLIVKDSYCSAGEMYHISRSVSTLYEQQLIHIFSNIWKQYLLLKTLGFEGNCDGFKIIFSSFLFFSYEAVHRKRLTSVLTKIINPKREPLTNVPKQPRSRAFFYVYHDMGQNQFLGL